MVDGLRFYFIVLDFVGYWRVWLKLDKVTRVTVFCALRHEMMTPCVYEQLG